MRVYKVDEGNFSDLEQLYYKWYIWTIYYLGNISLVKCNYMRKI